MQILKGGEKLMEREQRWEEIKAEIKCPLRPGELCRKSEGIKENEITLSHSAIILTAECNFCGSKASGWE